MKTQIELKTVIIKKVITGELEVYFEEAPTLFQARGATRYEALGRFFELICRNNLDITIKWL